MFSRVLIGAVAAAIGPAILAAGPSLSALAQAALAPQELRLPSSGGDRRVTLWVADGFVVDVFASRLQAARMLAQSPSGELVLSQHWEGRVVKLADRDGDGAADEVVTILENLNIPHGLAFDGDALLIAESHKVIRLDPWWDGDSARELLRLPGHGHHETRSLLIGGDRKLYVSIGSSCDACVEQDLMRAAVWRFNLDGSGGEPYATGLRNAVGLAWDARSGRAWVTENERNELGEDLPPDEVNALESGADFGWPYCFGMGIVAEPFGDAARCAQTRPPTVELPAHSAPLGLAFYDATRFPSEYRGDLFVALHGSALRESPVGYSLVRVPIRDGQPQQAVDFIRGWLVGDNSWGRPVAPLVARDGTLFISDDKAGAIYRVRPR
jgi:glucose/arabinose dehydrogenase